MWRETCCSLKNSCQKLLTNTLSLSLTKVLGTPCNLKTLSKYAWATVTAKKGWHRWVKWAYLLSLSTTTKTVSLPVDLGNPSTKSKETSTQTARGIGSGYNNPPEADTSDLYCWQVLQALIKFLTSLCSPFQKNNWWILFVVIVTPEWPPSAESWKSWMMWLCNSWSPPTTTLPSLYRTPWL